MDNKELDLFVESIYRLKHKLVKIVFNLILDYEIKWGKSQHAVGSHWNTKRTRGSGSSP